MGAIGNYEVVEVPFAFEGFSGSEADYVLEAPEDRKILSVGWRIPGDGSLNPLRQSYPNSEGTEWHLSFGWSAGDGEFTGYFVLTVAEFC